MSMTDLLFYLHKVILQDSVALCQQFSGHPVWNHPVFQHEAYASFTQKVEACQDAEIVPNLLSVLYQAMPQLADHMQALDAWNEQRQKELKTIIEQQDKQALQQSLQQLQQFFASGNLTVRLEAPQQQPSLQLLLPPPQLLLQPPLPLLSSDMALSQYASARVSVAATLLAHSPSPNPIGLGEPPKYQMCHTAKTVEALWHEWTVGLQGRPSINMLDRQWGSQWRAGCCSELQFYSLQLEIIREIRHIAQAQRTSEEAAMWQVSKQQQNMKCSLD
jgi:Transcriptional activator of glycolytic enzymes/Centromere DNA-binding protein complex CBF3 subunit, domain 2